MGLLTFLFWPRGPLAPVGEHLCHIGTVIPDRAGSSIRLKVHALDDELDILGSYVLTITRETRLLVDGVEADPLGFSGSLDLAGNGMFRVGVEQPGVAARVSIETT